MMWDTLVSHHIFRSMIFLNIIDSWWPKFDQIKRLFDFFAVLSYSYSRWCSSSSWSVMNRSPRAMKLFKSGTRYITLVPLYELASKRPTKNCRRKKHERRYVRRHFSRIVEGIYFAHHKHVRCCRPMWLAWGQANLTPWLVRNGWQSGWPMSRFVAQ